MPPLVGGFFSPYLARVMTRPDHALILFIFDLLSRLPLRVNHALGAALGWFVWMVPNRLKQKTIENIARCFADKDSSWQKSTARASLIETGKALTEAPWLWRAGPSRIQALRQPGENEHLLEEALRSDTGVFLVSPHLGSWEFAGLQAASFGPMTSMYRPPRAHWLDEPIRRARSATGAKLAPADRSGLRMIRDALQNGGIVGLLPDQKPKRGQGVPALFFGQPALTMTLLPKLARQHGARVLFAFAERLPKGQGYRYRCIPTPKNLFDPDVGLATQALNQAVEQLVRQCPNQYVWSYERFGDL